MLEFWGVQSTPSLPLHPGQLWPREVTPERVLSMGLLYRGKEEIHSETVNCLSTEVIQSNKYYKSRAVGVTSEVGLTSDQDFAETLCLRNTTSFIPPWYRKSRGTSHYTTGSNRTVWNLNWVQKNNMLNWIVWNRTVWSFNCVYLLNVLRNHIFDIYIKTGFGIK